VVSTLYPTVQGTSNESGMTLELVKQRKRIVTELVTGTGYPLSKHGILTLPPSRQALPFPHGVHRGLRAVDGLALALDWFVSLHHLLIGRDLFFLVSLSLVPIHAVPLALKWVTRPSGFSWLVSGRGGGLGDVEVAHAPGVNRRRSAHKTATHISVDLVIVLFRVDVTCHTSRVTVTRHNVCCI